MKRTIILTGLVDGVIARVVKTSTLASEEHKGSGMKRMHLGVTLAALVVAGLLVSPASAVTYPHTTGTWYFRPDQTFTTSSVVTHGFTYQTAVRPPINCRATGRPSVA